jgi:hypothetical protein
MYLLIVAATMYSIQTQIPNTRKLLQ